MMSENYMHGDIHAKMWMNNSERVRKREREISWRDVQKERERERAGEREREIIKEINKRMLTFWDITMHVISKSYSF